MPAVVQWPRRPVSTEGGDILAPLRHLLLGLNLVELRTTAEADQESKDIDKGTATPWSEQAVNAGALGLSKVIGTVVSVGGGVGAAATGIAGFTVTNSLERIAAVGGVSAILVATVIGLAVIVRADVQARAVASAAQYEARARVTDAFLTRSHPVATPRFFITSSLKSQEWVEVARFEMLEGGLAARTIANDHILATDIKGITTVDVQTNQSQQ